jgi:hypothetical protein
LTGSKGVFTILLVCCTSGGTGVGRRFGGAADIDKCRFRSQGITLANFKLNDPSRNSYQKIGQQYIWLTNLIARFGCQLPSFLG